MELLHQLERLYLELPSTQGNACGSCFACCTAMNHFHHQVSPLELEYIAWKVGPEAARRMARYVARATLAEQLEFPTCPHYDRGCTIYPHRPFSCRVFGHYREQGTRLPEGCTFAGSEQEFARQDYYAVVPQARNLRALTREFSIHVPRSPGQVSDLSWLDAQDPVDRAVGHLAQSDYAGALENLLKELERRPEGSGFVWHTLGLVYGLLERHQLAAEAFEKAAGLLPDHVECLSQLGSSLMLAGKLEEGTEKLKRVLELDPERSSAHGLLGYAALLREEWQQAAEHLHAALQLEPENAFYRARLSQALQADKANQQG